MTKLNQGHSKSGHCVLQFLSHCVKNRVTKLCTNHGITKLIQVKYLHQKLAQNWVESSPKNHQVAVISHWQFLIPLFEELSKKLSESANTPNWERQIFKSSAPNQVNKLRRIKCINLKSFKRQIAPKQASKLCQMNTSQSQHGRPPTDEGCHGPSL